MRDEASEIRRRCWRQRLHDQSFVTENPTRPVKGQGESAAERKKWKGLLKRLTKRIVLLPCELGCHLWINSSSFMYSLAVHQGQSSPLEIASSILSRIASDGSLSGKRSRLTASTARYHT